MITEAFLSGALGSLLWLDRFQIFQIMISRPIVSAPLVGWMAGNLHAGIASGLLFEMLWLRRPPVGGFISPDVTLSSIAVSAVSALVRSKTGAELLPLVFLVFLTLLPVSFVGTKLDVLLRTLVGRIARRAEGAQSSGADLGMFRYFASALGLGFSIAFLFLVPVIASGALLLECILPLLPSYVMRAAGLAFYVVPLLGVLDLFAGLDRTQHGILFLMGFMAAVAGCLIVAWLG